MNYLERIKEKSKAHHALSQSWNSYFPLDFGGIFLPKSDNFTNTKGDLKIFDALEVFSNKDFQSKNVLQLKELESSNVFIYTFDKLATASTKTESISLKENDICLFLELIDDKQVNVISKIGGKSRSLFNKYLNEGNNLSNQIKVSTEFINQFFGKKVSKLDVFNFMLNISGAPTVKKTKVDFSELKLAIKNYKLEYPEFDAGIKKNSAHTFSHGDIELVALKGIFSEDQIYKIYYGNWLRDYSSLITGLAIGFSKMTLKF